MIKSPVGKYYKNGRNCTNNPSDVNIIKQLLNNCNFLIHFMPYPLKVDGQCNQPLIDAIINFQVSVMKVKADGVISPRHNTIKKLQQLFFLTHNNERVFWPLQNNIIRRKKINHTFGMVRTDKNGKQKPHQGWDFEAKAGVTPTFAIANGMIVKVENRGLLGLRITLGFNFKGNVYFAFYAHMQSNSVKQGDLVFIGDNIGICGKSGNAGNLKAVQDEHLHFEIRTKPSCPRGLKFRLSPKTVFGKCPLKAPVFQQHDFIFAEKNSYLA